MLVDGRVLTLSNYFDPAGGEANELFISSDGEITKVALETGPDGMVFADYGAVQGHDKWNPYDQISFYEGEELIANADADEVTGMAAFAPALLGGLGGAGLAAGAGLVGLGLLSGGTGSGGGSSSGANPPSVTVTDGVKSSNDVINAADAADGVTVTGSGTPGATIKVTVDNKDQTTTVGNDGTWTVTYPTGTLTGGERETGVTVTATNSGGSTTTTSTLVFDTIASLTATSTAGGADGVINKTEALSGAVVTGTVDAGSTVTLTLANGTTVPVTVTGTTWTATVPASYFNGEGSLGYTVTATDSYQNVATPVSGTLVYDTIASLTATSTAGGADAIINKTESASGVAVTGTVDAGSTVVLTLANGATVPVTVTGTTWTATVPASYFNGEGSLGYTVTATDSHQNVATPVSGTLVYDTLVNTFTQTGSTGGADGVVSRAEAGSVTIGGQVEAGTGSTVTVTLANGATIQATVSGTTWSATIPSQYVSGEGTLTYTAVAKDTAGNLSSPLSGSVRYDTILNSLTATPSSVTAGSDGFVNKTEGTNGAAISGTVEAGATSVTITLADGSTVQGFVNGTTWSATIPAAKIPSGEGTITYTVTAQDQYGNTTSTNGATMTASGSVAYDTVVQNFAHGSSTNQVAGGNGVVNINEAASGVTVGGSVEAGSTVSVTVNGVSYGATVTGTSWSVTLPASVMTGTSGTVSYTVNATDSHQNVASLNQSFTYDLATPDAIDVIGTTETNNVISKIEVAATDDTLSFARVLENGDVSQLTSTYWAGDAASEEYKVNGGTGIPDGSYLVVSTTDTAGNQSATLAILNEDTATTVDLSRAGLDLRFLDDRP